MKCQARQFNDEMICNACHLRWDTNDPDPPQCRQGQKGLTLEQARKEVSSLLKVQIAPLPQKSTAQMFNDIKSLQGTISKLQSDLAKLKNEYNRAKRHERKQS